MRCFFLLLLVSLSLGFAPSQFAASRPSATVELFAEAPTGRRAFFNAAAVLGTAALLSSSSPALAAEPTIWLTGKAPKVPGEKPKDKSDTKGTRKDPSFLRSISDCKSQCEQSSGYGNASRSKEECLQDCQDICCETYQQYVLLCSILILLCYGGSLYSFTLTRFSFIPTDRRCTFAIVPR